MSGAAGLPIRPKDGSRSDLAALDRLPPPDTRRWVARRKAEVVSAVQAGVLSLEAACDRYGISVEEFEIWQAALRRHGIGGLRVTQIQIMKRQGNMRPSRQVADDDDDLGWQRRG